MKSLRLTEREFYRKLKKITIANCTNIRSTVLLSQLRDISLEGCRLMSSPSKEPLRIEGNKIIYSDDPLVYVIENYLTDKECQHLIDLSKNKFKLAKTMNNKDYGDASIYNHDQGLEQAETAGLNIPHQKHAKVLAVESRN